MQTTPETYAAGRPHAQVQKPSFFRGFIQGKTRVVLAWLFAIGLIFSAKEPPAAPGILLCALGAALRHWASGCLRKDAFPAVGGPYRFVRNPLYLGTYLMALGTALATQNWVLLGAVTLVFAVLYHFIILDEEVKLDRIFGALYALYLNSVPRFFPSFRPAPIAVLRQINPDREALSFSSEVAKKNKAFEAWVTFFALIGGVWIASILWQQFV